VKRRKLLYAEPPLKQTESNTTTQSAIAVRSKATVTLNKNVTETLDEYSSGGGVSLINVVVTIAVITALSIGGFISYNGIVSNAHDMAAKSQLDTVATAELYACASGAESCFVPLKEIAGQITPMPGNDDSVNSSGVRLELHADPENPKLMSSFTATVTSKTGKVFKVTDKNTKAHEVKEEFSK
jgi:Tfp pilus assembly protein PilE